MCASAELHTSTTSLLLASNVPQTCSAGSLIRPMSTHLLQGSLHGVHVLQWYMCSVSRLQTRGRNVLKRCTAAICIGARESAIFLWDRNRSGRSPQLSEFVPDQRAVSCRHRCLKVVTLQPLGGRQLTEHVMAPVSDPRSKAGHSDSQKAARVKALLSNYYGDTGDAEPDSLASMQQQQRPQQRGPDPAASAALTDLDSNEFNVDR